MTLTSSLKLCLSGDDRFCLAREDACRCPCTRRWLVPIHQASEAPAFSAVRLRTECDVEQRLTLALSRRGAARETDSARRADETRRARVDRDRGLLSWVRLPRSFSFESCANPLRPDSMTSATGLRATLNPLRGTPAHHAVRKAPGVAVFLSETSHRAARGAPGSRSPAGPAAQPACLVSLLLRHRHRRLVGRGARLTSS